MYVCGQHLAALLQYHCGSPGASDDSLGTTAIDNYLLINKNIKKCLNLGWAGPLVQQWLFCAFFYFLMQCLYKMHSGDLLQNEAITNCFSCFSVNLHLQNYYIMLYYYITTPKALPTFSTNIQGIGVFFKSLTAAMFLWK